MEVEFTKHAAEKFLEEVYVKDVKITKKKIFSVIEKPAFKKRQGEKIFAVGDLAQRHVLVVIYKKVGKRAKVITFFPARKGRYES